MSEHVKGIATFVSTPVGSGLIALAIWEYTGTQCHDSPFVAKCVNGLWTLPETVTFAGVAGIVAGAGQGLLVDNHEKQKAG